MLQMRRNIIFVCLLAIALWGNGNVLAENQKVIIVLGVSESDFNIIAPLQTYLKALTGVLDRNNIVYENQFVPLENAENEVARDELVKNAVEKIRQSKPNAIVVLNDNAVKSIAMQIDDIPVVAGYIFGAPNSLGFPKPNLTGVARRSFAVDIWAMARQITGSQTVSLLSQKNSSMAEVRKGLLSKTDELEQLSGVRLKEMYLCDTFDEWQKLVTNWSEDLIYLADTSRILRDGKEVPSDELVQWTVQHAKVPVIAANEEAARDGALFSMVTSEAAWGEQTGQMLTKVLGGTPISEIPVEQVLKGKLIINAKTAMAQKIDIPYEIISSADHVYE